MLCFIILDWFIFIIIMPCIVMSDIDCIRYMNVYYCAVFSVGAMGGYKK